MVEVGGGCGKESQQEKSPPCFTRRAPMVYKTCPFVLQDVPILVRVRERDKNNNVMLMRRKESREYHREDVIARLD